MADDSTLEEIGLAVSRLVEATDNRPLSETEGNRLNEYIRRLKRLKETDKRASAILEYARMAQHQDDAYRAKTETDRASDAEIAAAAGLGRDHDESDPMESLPDDHPAPLPIEDVFKPGETVDRALQDADPIVQTIHELRKAGARGFDLTRPRQCGPLFAVLADLSARTTQDAADRVAPLRSIDPRAWGDAFGVDDDKRSQLAYRHYCEMRRRYGLPEAARRQYQRDLQHGLNTIRNYRRTGKIPRRGKKS